VCISKLDIELSSLASLGGQDLRVILVVLTGLQPERHVVLGELACQALVFQDGGEDDRNILPLNAGDFDL